MIEYGDKLKVWASILDPVTLQQAFDTVKMDFIYPHLALMPDAHLGKGATVGSVIPTLGAIMPAAVGVDIGCGMIAYDTGVPRDVELIRLREVHSEISRAIPLSAGGYNKKITKSAEARIAKLEALPGIKQADEVSPNWRYQLGSLGSGNHFIEISEDEYGLVWLFLHSGSRGVGNRLASKHIQVAKTICKDRGVSLPNQDLAYLEEGTEEFDAYIEALQWAQTFALLNREEMMTRVKDVWGINYRSNFNKGGQTINCHHNYTVKETYGGKEVWLSRKGAIDAHQGIWGLIPGSMGDLSYVVTGLGNELALNSSPHGAGRNHSRSTAKKLFNREDLDERMQGIVWGESDAFLDEHPEAYKPIDQVMKDSADLVKVEHEFRQFVNVKGD